jgi:hypothetical protein
MVRNRRVLIVTLPVAAILFGAVLRLGPIRAGDDPGKPAQASDVNLKSPSVHGAKTWTTAVVPKPLSPNVKKGLDWLVEHQIPGGGWGEGEESPYMRQGGNDHESLRDKPNVADTSIAALALLRSGSTPREGLYKDAIVNAVRFVRSQVESSDSDSLAVTPVRGTRVQQKLGPNIDTFLASMLLAEVKGRMPDEASGKAIELALAKVVRKIERHQKEDGSFDGAGWAPILAQAMCGKGINRARQAGASVPERVLARAENGAKLAFQQTSPAMAGGVGGSFAGEPLSVTRSAGRGAAMGMMAGAAGVELYSRAASVGVLQDSVNTNTVLAKGLEARFANSRDQKERESTKEKLAQIAETERVHQEAQASVIARLDDKQFVAGFGSNGGEEFLSYMNLAESLVFKGGEEWKKWDSEMTANLNRVQNGDGSWSGHHCITGRTFCTSTALLVLMADRTPIPVGAKQGTHEAAK